MPHNNDANIAQPAQHVVHLALVHGFLQLIYYTPYSSAVKIRGDHIELVESMACSNIARVNSHLRHSANSVYKYSVLMHNAVHILQWWMYHAIVGVDCMGDHTIDVKHFYFVNLFIF